MRASRHDATRRFREPSTPHDDDTALRRMRSAERAAIECECECEEEREHIECNASHTHTHTHTEATSLWPSHTGNFSCYTNTFLIERAILHDRAINVARSCNFLQQHAIFPVLPYVTVFSTLRLSEIYHSPKMITLIRHFCLDKFR